MQSSDKRQKYRSLALHRTGFEHNTVSSREREREREGGGGERESPSMFCIGNILLKVFAHEGFVKACPVGLT